MGNSTFGFDPDPGQIKMLRIYTRGPDGRPRMFEHRESSTVDGAQFTGWGRGEWGREGWNGRWNDGDDDRDDDQDRDRDHERDRERTLDQDTPHLREVALCDQFFRSGTCTMR